MKFTIVPPKESGKELFVKEFDSWKQVNAYLRSKNFDIYEGDPATEDLNFRLDVID